MKNKKDITVIIPLHKYDEQIEALLKRAVNSIVEGYPIHLIVPKTIERDIHISDTKVEMFVSDEESSDFCTLVNDGVSTVETKWFSILEFDDEYTKIWFDNVEKQIEYTPDVSVFLPLEELTDFNKNNFIGYGNEAPWATSFSNEVGYIDNDCLQQYFDFYLTGGVFNADDWKNQGGLKPLIQVTFWYEFLLRITNNSKKVYVIPKLGYKHYVDREDSLYSNYRKVIDEKESQWYFDLAKRESFFKTQREPSKYQYNPNEE